MRDLLKNGYQAKKRPSGHDISKKFIVDNGAAIPPNLIALPNTESNSYYLRYCAKKKIKAHPARYPAGIPEYFIRMLTESGDLVVDPFGGSCITGEVAERLNRHWLCGEMVEEYLKGALGRFVKDPDEPKKSKKQKPIQKSLFKNPEDDESNFYKLPRPGLLWNGTTDPPLQLDGGKARPKKTD